MYCKYCGQKIDDDSTFCSGCGAKLTIAVKQTKPCGNNKQEQTHTQEQNHSCSITKHTGFNKQMPKYTEDDFEPTLKNIMNQFTPLGRFVFIILCILMIVWVATLTIYIFYPDWINFLSTL